MSRRILVVDDDGLVLRSVAKVLSRAGYNVLTAVDVESALRQADTGPIDAALVDYQLARENGLTVLSTLREAQPTCIRVLLTGRSDPAMMVEAVNRGEVAKVVKKPFEGKDLLRELDEAFDSAERMKKVATELTGAEAEAERQALEQAVRGELLGMALQPLFDFAEAIPRLFAMEALLRPKHAKLNNPLALIATAERHDRILDVGDLVLHRVRDIAPRVSGDVRMFVNLHPQQLGHPDRLARELAPLAAWASRITFEITEQSSLQKLDRWEESIRQLTESGFSIAVDDLGAGYSSLSILADLQPQFIKLDMSLVRNIHRETRKQRLVALMRAFGDATDARVIAEGVESEDEFRALRDCGIHLMQGYHFARPSERFTDFALVAQAK